LLFWKFLTRMLNEQKMKLVTVTVLMAAVALMEGVAVMLLVPLMNVVMGEGGALTGVLGNLGKFIENAFAHFNVELTLTWVLSMLVAAFIIQGALRLLMMHLQGKMLTRYEYSLIHRLFDGYFASSWDFFVRSRAGQLVNVISVETHRAFVAFQSTCSILVTSLIALFYIILSLLLSWQITLAGVVLCATASLVLKKFMERAHSYGLEMSDVNNQLQAQAYDKIAAAKMLKSSATEKTAVNNLDAIADRKADLGYKSMINSALIPSVYLPLIISSLALIVFFALGPLQVNFAVILLFTYIFFRLTPYFSTIQLDYQQVLLNIPAVAEIDKTIELARSMAETKGDRLIQGVKKTIVFRDVNFAYGRGKPVLKKINLEINKGETIAVVGESGVGKTTLVDLLLGLFTPTGGSILVDGSPLNDYNPQSWRKLIGYISQDVFLFHDTVIANLKWMVPDATKEQVEAAAKAAYAHEFITQMPQGYDSVIGDRGVKLSGGQRQRLALARMILQDPEIIILDEPTSALDAESEAKVQEAITGFIRGKTVIVISHRTSLLTDVRRVYQIQDGAITVVDRKG